MRVTTAWWLLAASLVIAGCGGGGGGTTCTSNCVATVLSVTAVTPANGATGVAVTSAITAAFNAPMNASTITASTFTLAAQGGSAVTGTVTLNSSNLTATFTPSASLANNTTYTATITTAAQSSAGTALASNYTWSFTTALVAAPTVSSVTPTNASTNVAITSAVTATFSEAMNVGSITSSTFTLVPLGGSAIAATVSYAANVATLTPTAQLINNTTYTATITTGVTSSGGVALASNYTWTFTTAQGPAPTVTAATPTNGATDIAITSAVTATFSEAMLSSTITGSTLTLTPQGGSAVAATVTYAANVATLTPTTPLAYNTTYTATITTGVQSSLGTALSANYTWTFTTATAPPPGISAVTPANLSTTAAISTTVTATFNQTMNSATITGSTFTLTGPGNTSVQGTVAYNAVSSVATFTPSANLAYNTAYVATLSASIMSSAGVALSPAYVWSFTTAVAPVPIVTATAPASGATGVNVANALSATFSQPMNSATLTASTFTLTGPGNTAVAGLISYNTGTSTATFTPNASLAYNTSYTATITTGATSAAGAALASNDAWTFTTGASPDQVTVDFGTTYQTIRGFGGSTAWLGEMPSAVATALFSPTSGLGLSILRVRIDPEGSSTGGGSKGDPYETSEWDYEAANGSEAVAANPNAIVFASPWTPPATWKLSGTSTTVSGTTFNEAFNGTCTEGAGYCGGYLDPNHYADYANYLEDFVRFFNTTDSFHLYAISMQNEPEENVSYESCVWTPQQMDAWIAGNASTITSDAYSTKLIMPESDNFNPVDASVALSDSSAQGLISIIGGHIYGVSPVPYSIPSGDSPKELWMTEFGPLSNATLTWSEALTTYGESIHNSMVTGQYNAYVWWGLFGASSGTCATNAGTCGLVDDAGNVQPMGYVMGQYSKFIQPGFARVSATATPVTGVYVSAYSNASPSHYAIVVINANSSSESLTFVLNNGSGVTSLTPYQSTSSAGLAAQTAVTVSSGQFSYTLPAQSIVTFYQ
ncbi:MAG: Ig-like domain-containing protein [Terracidiphilus sp.]|jgi:O-glycosyl hydrolase